MNKLIKINNHYYVIDDSEIKESDNYLWLNNNQICKAEGMLMTINNHVKNKHIVRITHSTQKGIGEQLNLNDIEELVNGYSIREMAEIDAHLVWNDETTFENEQRELNGHIIGFIEGFKAHKELSKDKLFTVEDIRTIFTHRKQLGLTITGNIRNGSDQPDKENWFNESIKLLLPPTEWNIEFQNGKIILV